MYEWIKGKIGSGLLVVGGSQEEVGAKHWEMGRHVQVDPGESIVPVPLAPFLLIPTTSHLGPWMVCGQSKFLEVSGEVN